MIAFRMITFCSTEHLMIRRNQCHCLTLIKDLKHTARNFPLRREN